MLEFVRQPLQSGSAVIRIHGRMLIGEGTERLTTVSNEAMEEGARALVFDLSDVSHLDSTGLGQFIAVMSNASTRGVSILIAGAGPTIRHTFRVTRLDKVFPSYETVEQALATLPA